MPAYYLIYMEMYVLGTNKLKMHTTGVPTFKKNSMLVLNLALFVAKVELKDLQIGLV